MYIMYSTCYVLVMDLFCVSCMFVYSVLHASFLMVSPHHSPRLGIINRAKPPQRDISKIVALSKQSYGKLSKLFFGFFNFAMI